MHRRVGPSSSRPQGAAGSSRARCTQTSSLQQRGVHTHATSSGHPAGDPDRRATSNQLLPPHPPPSWLSSAPTSSFPSSHLPSHHFALRRGAPSRLPAPRALGGSQFENLPPIPDENVGDKGEGQGEDEEEEEFFSRLPSSSFASSSSSSAAAADLSSPPRLRPKRVRFRSFADDAASRAPPPPPCPIFGEFERRSVLPSSAVSPSAASAASSSSSSSSPPPSSSPPFVLVRPLLQPEIPDAASLLTDGFAAAMGYPAQYRRLLRNHIVSYLRAHTRLSPAAVVLGARLVEEETEGDEQTEDLSAAAAAAASPSPPPSSPALSEEEEESGELLPPPPPLPPALREEGASAGRSSPLPPPPPPPPPLPGMLAGSVEVSFSSSTRTKSLTLNPPDESAYLCNMAVHPGLRSRGIGAALLSAAADAARVAGASELFLHLRVKDAEGPAGRLYLRSGFEEAGRDGGLLAFFGQDRRLLLRKKL